MKQRQLNNGKSLPPIGFGTWQILPSIRAKRAVLDALKAGYRLIDTARIYGNEKGVGAAIRESGIARSDIFVTTKLWNSDQGYESALQAFDKSLERLGLEYVDLYLIHWPGGKDRAGSWRALEEIYKSGRAKNIGVSNYMIKHLKELLATSDIVPVVNQVEFHPFLFEELNPLLQFCHDQGIVIEAYSPLARGSRQMKHKLISDIAKEHNKTNAQIMLRWAVQHGTVPLPKSTHRDRMLENINIFDFELSEKDMAALNSISTGMHRAWDPTDID